MGLGVAGDVVVLELKTHNPGSIGRVRAGNETAPINAVEESRRGVCTVIVPNVEGYIGWVSRESGIR